MSAKALYALTVLLAVGALSFLLRALPFLLFGGRKEPPCVVKYIGRVLAPAAIAMLVVYCYAGEAAKDLATITASSSRSLSSDSSTLMMDLSPTLRVWGLIPTKE